MRLQRGACASRVTRRTAPRCAAAPPQHRAALAAALAAGARSAACALALAATLAAPLHACAAVAQDAEEAAQARNDAAISGGERAFRPVSAAEAAAKRALFTPDAYAGMVALGAYAEYVESLRGAEAAPGCEACAAERQRYERAWQTVANEAFSGAGFTQAAWAGQLRATLAAAGGTLRDGGATAAAVRSLVASLRDPYSAYLPPPEWRAALGRPLPAERAYAEALAVGVGLQLTSRAPDASGWRVAPLASSPAEEAGVQPGDVLAAIDGEAVGDFDRGAVTALLRGPEGSVATLRLLSPARTLQVTRRALPLPPVVPPVLLPLPGRAAPALLLRVRYFSSQTTADIAKALRYGSLAGAGAYVIDVRNNPGGVLEEAIASAALFAPCGARLAQTRRAADAPPDVRYVACALPAGQFAAPPPAPLVATGVPLAVLVNGGTASAAEAFAAALRDAGGARLLGSSRTFGKSQVQFFFPLADGGGLRLTVRKWLTPRRGDDVSAPPRGLRPDTPCGGFPRDRDAPMQDACVRDALALLDAR